MFLKKYRQTTRKEHMEQLTESQEKKAKKVFFSVAKTTGLGVGLFILALIAPMISESVNGEALRQVFIKYGAIIMIYAVIMVSVYLFMRKQIMPLHMAMQWVILPSVAVMFLMDGYQAIVSNKSAEMDQKTKAIEKAYVPQNAKDNKWGLKELVVDE